MCDSTGATHEEMIEKLSGTFGIFCWASTKINEEIIKAAGVNNTLNLKHRPLLYKLTTSINVYLYLTFVYT